MVDVGDKQYTERTAKASGRVFLGNAFDTIQENIKGDVLAVARISGMQASKKTSELIPLCHQLNLSKVAVDFKIENETKSIKIIGVASCVGPTGGRHRGNKSGNGGIDCCFCGRIDDL